MKRAMLLALSLILMSATADAAWFTEDEQTSSCSSAAGAGFETAFSPSEQVNSLIVKSIRSAKKSIRIVTRSFISKPLAEALIASARSPNHTDVKIVVDKKMNSGGYSAAPFMKTMGYAPRLSGKDIHMSFMVIDEKDVVIGSISAIPETEDEKKDLIGALVIHNAPDLAKHYFAAWQKAWDSSTEMPGK